MRQPPRPVPAVSAAEQATITQVGAERESIRPSASRSAAITPTDFCASLAPWLKESAAEVTHWPPWTLPRQRWVARLAAPRRVRITSSAARPPSTGETARAISVPKTPTGCSPSIPPQLTAWTPPFDDGGPDEAAHQGMT